MATIPIEVILQDAEAPVDPTPTSETNIVVPDTGAGTVGSDSTLTGSSAASIILPAILLVVALATVCIMLIHKHHKYQNSDKLNKKEKLATAASGTIAILAATVLVGNLVIPATNAATSVDPGTADLDVADKITITATREADSDTVIATAQNISYATANLDFGYKVSASMAEGTTTANLYLDGNTDSEYYIAPVSDGILTDNTWGYTLSEEAEEYLAIPLADTPATIAKGNGVVEDESVDTYYAVKVDKSLPAGTYAGELEYDIAPAVEYMQDFATMTEQEKATVLANMPEGEQYILKDNRDEKPYYISKLADSKVWMTQNLDLEKEGLLPNVTINTENTDNPATGFVLPTSQIEGSDTWGPWDDGAATNTTHVYDLASNGQTYFYCTEYAPWGECMAYDTTPIPSANLGNYYNWYTATAGTGTYELTDGDVASGSICPAGWRLSTGANSSDVITDYSNLLYLYGILKGPAVNSGYNSSKLSDMFAAPLYFMRAGNYYDGVDDVGVDGNVWSSMAGSNNHAKALVFSGTSLIPWGSLDHRIEGYSVRCLAK